jgi:hypothetical protein
MATKLDERPSSGFDSLPSRADLDRAKSANVGVLSKWGKPELPRSIRCRRSRKEAPGQQNFKPSWEIGQ